MKAELVPTESVKCHPLLQMRAGGLDDAHRDSLARAIANDPDLLTLYPISVGELPDGLTVLDGHHRLEAARQAGLACVPVVVMASTMKEAMIFSAGANDHVGQALKRTDADRRKAVQLLLSDPDCRKMTDTAISKVAGCSITTVGNIRRENPDFQSDIRVDRDGREIRASDSVKSPTRAPASTSREGSNWNPSKNPFVKAIMEIPGRTPPKVVAEALLDFYGLEKCREITDLLVKSCGGNND